MQPTIGHHLILGELIDFITGETIQDTHDERYRQKIARFLIEHKGYLKKDIEPRCELLVTAENNRAKVKIDFKVKLFGKIFMVIKYGPGSLVTRHRCAIAASRLVAPYQVPLVVVTNGENADTIDGPTGRIIASGFASIPSKADLVAGFENREFREISAKQAEMEARIVYAFEVDGSCPCDDTVCRL